MSLEVKIGETVSYTISDTQLKVLKTYINEDNLEQTFSDLITVFVRDNCNWYSNKFRDEWIAILQQDPEVTTIPVSGDAFVDMVITRPDYKTKKQQETPEVPE